MSLVDRASRLRFGAGALLALAVASGCAAQAHYAKYPRSPSTAFQEHQATTLGRIFDPAAAKHPGESGVLFMMAYGEGGARAIRSIFERVAGDRGGEFVDLSTATIRAVAKGVLGVAFLQAIIVGICLLIAGIPWAGVLAAIVLVLGIAQVPALIAMPGGASAGFATLFGSS